MLNHPRPSPTVRPCCSYFLVFSSPTATIEVIETLEIWVLKRLASAVQLGPWPPSFQSPTAMGRVDRQFFLQAGSRSRGSDKWKSPSPGGTQRPRKRYAGR